MDEQTDRQGGQTDRRADLQMDGQTDREADRMDIETDMLTDKWMGNVCTGKQMNGHEDRRMDGHISQWQHSGATLASLSGGQGFDSCSCR